MSKNNRHSSRNDKPVQSMTILNPGYDARMAEPTAASAAIQATGGTNQIGGASRDRTDDLKLAKLALSQLSYGPLWIPAARTRPHPLDLKSAPGRSRQRTIQQNTTQAHHASGASMVGLGGLEPPTSRLSGVRSNHLSYRPDNLQGQANLT
jgi:hypothetical protein